MATTYINLLSTIRNTYCKFDNYIQKVENALLNKNKQLQQTYEVKKINSKLKLHFIQDNFKNTNSMKHNEWIFLIIKQNT